MLRENTRSWTVPYIPTPLKIVREMLRMARAGGDDVLYDLGCGDGRILVMAVKEFGVKKAVGYEIRGDLCEYAKSTVVGQGLQNEIRIVHEDLFHADLSEVTVITLYLNLAFNELLRPKLEHEARARTRVVSRDFEIEEWIAKRKEVFDGHEIFLYTIPESLIFSSDAKRETILF